MIPDEELNKLYSEIPEISFENPRKMLLKCISLKNYTSTPCPKLSNRTGWNKNKGLYNYLCAAFLRENYLLQVDFTSNWNRVFYFKKGRRVV